MSAPLLFLFACTLVLPSAAVLPDPDLERATRDALLDALAEAHITHKEAYLLMSFSKGHWSDICAGLKPTPSHTRLLKLPWAFWQAYLPKLAYAVARKNVIEIAQDMRFRG